MATISRSIDLQGVAELIKSYGQDPDALAKMVGLDPRALYETGITIESRHVINLHEEAARACKDRFFALKLAQVQGWDILGPIWLMIRSAETVKEALQAIADHLELHTAGVSAYLIEEEDRTVFCYEVRKQARGADILDQSEVQVIELGLAMSCYELRAILGNAWRPQYVQFRHAAPYNPEPLQQVFGEHLSFNQDRNAIHLTREDGMQPLATSRPAYRQILQREIHSRLGDTIPFALRADRTIRVLIDEGGCSVEKIAVILGVSPRTLQLRLKEEGTSYQTLYDQARLEIAIQYLENSNLPITAIAERLQFSHTGAFSRFFKRHMGMTPRELLKGRRSLSPEQPGPV
jgi:AraC-like DNA-binding protein